MRSRDNRRKTTPQIAQIVTFSLWFFIHLVTIAIVIETGERIQVEVATITLLILSLRGIKITKDGVLFQKDLLPSGENWV